MNMDIVIIVLNFIHLIIAIECVPNIRLNDGNQTPILGLGSYQLNSIQQYLNAIEIGYRHIDTAHNYYNERYIGQALKQAFDEQIVKREDIFITIKVWCNYQTRALALQNIESQLETLDLDYADLALLHYPVNFKVGPNDYPLFPNRSIIPMDWKKDFHYIDAYKGIEDAQRLGLVKSIGISNFYIQQIEKLMDNTYIKPAVNQFENNPFFNQEILVQFCQNNNITVTAYSPIRLGKIQLLNDPILNDIGNKYNKSGVQVALKWNIQRGIVVIPRSHDTNRQRENFNVFDFTLTNDEIWRIYGIKALEKLYMFYETQNLPDYPNREMLGYNVIDLEN